MPKRLKDSTNNSIIDLTTVDESDSKPAARRRVATTSRRNATTSTTGTTTSTTGTSSTTTIIDVDAISVSGTFGNNNSSNFYDLEDNEDENTAILHFLGSMTCNIVGIKYYNGVAHPEEYVNVIREPKNPYDKNAIRIDNIHNEKVGHIKATTAYFLSKIIDQYHIRCMNTDGSSAGSTTTTTTTAASTTMNHKICMDGTIALRGATSYSLPLLLNFYSESSSSDALLSDFTMLNNYLTSSAGSNWKPDKKLYNELNGKKNGTSDNNIVVSSLHIQWEQAQQHLDTMFDQIVNDQLLNLPDITVPLTITTPLLDHQIVGIKWLYQHEIMYNSNITTNSSAAGVSSSSSGSSSSEQQLSIPFYKEIQEKGRKMWLSEITNATQQSPPKRISGSILADDMGLGKSLQALGLILTNPPGTLIVCPVSVMSNWVMQIEQHLVPNTLKVGMYHGSDRANLLSKIVDYDVLITSYGTISTDYSNTKPSNDAKIPASSGGRKENKPPAKKKKTKNLNSVTTSIFDQTFHRIILDEAHTIRNVQSLTFAGCMALQSTYRLCLTGTPLQNKPEDIHSLLSFLNVEPLCDKSIFRRAIAQPIYLGDPIGLSRLRTIMAHIALRRNKSKLDLVTKTVEVRSVQFPKDCIHKTIHDTIFESAQIVFRATFTSDKQISKNYMRILETLMRIRQACISGNLVPKACVQSAEDVLKLVKGNQQLSVEDGEKLLEKLRGTFTDTEPTECAICLDTMEESDAIILRTCSHVFCEICMSKLSEQHNGRCPMCRCPYTSADLVKPSMAVEATMTDKKKAPIAEMLDDLGPSPKLQALELAISEMKVDEKGVIFSQFTKLLDVLEPFLLASGHTFVRIDGSKTATQRVFAMKEFNLETGGPRFILCSLHAAGTGITLTRGNHCFMMDTWWNSSVEQQAMDRIHRIGQKRPVRVIRFVMTDSIEERMIQLQEAKAAIGKGSMEKLKPEEARKARIGDLKSLFSINSKDGQDS